MRPAAVLVASSLISGLLVDHLMLLGRWLRTYGRPWWLPVDPS